MYENLLAIDPSITIRGFLHSCRTSLSAVVSLLCTLHPGHSRAEANTWVENVLADVIQERAGEGKLVRNVRSGKEVKGEK
jgi:hypothetical protein